VSSPPSTACRRHSACKQTAPHSLTAHTLCHIMLRCPCCCPCFCSCYYFFSAAAAASVAAAANGKPLLLLIAQCHNTLALHTYNTYH
jgi:hypothetical protein